MSSSNNNSETTTEEAQATGRKRPKPGERRTQILQTLATMLEQPGAERVTTAALAAKIQVSEAALYRHFASKAQMFEGLIEFIEQSVFGLVNQIAEREAHVPTRIVLTVQTLAQFAEKNPGMVRVMAGDALVFENERLQQRMNQLFDKLESGFRLALKEHAQSLGASTPSVEAQTQASVISAYFLGLLHRYARSGLKRMPTEHLAEQLALILPTR